jgi:hypothetical protein
MSNYTQVELNYIREIVTFHQILSSKLSSFSKQCQDPEIKELFSNASSSSQKSINDLIQIL